VLGLYGTRRQARRHLVTLCTIGNNIVDTPNSGDVPALTFRLTLGRPQRFAHSRDVAGFLGLRPKQRQSGACDPQLGISKSGDPYLRKLLVQCSHYILGHWGPDSALRRWGLGKAEGGKKASLRAIVAVARKLAVLLHRLCTTGAFYKPFPQLGFGQFEWRAGERILQGKQIRQEILLLSRPGRDRKEIDAPHIFRL
jgi:hypothetical protein